MMNKMYRRDMQKLKWTSIMSLLGIFQVKSQIAIPAYPAPPPVYMMPPPPPVGIPVPFPVPMPVVVTTKSTTLSTTPSTSTTPKVVGVPMPYPVPMAVPYAVPQPAPPPLCGPHPPMAPMPPPMPMPIYPLPAPPPVLVVPFPRLPPRFPPLPPHPPPCRRRSSSYSESDYSDYSSSSGDSSSDDHFWRKRAMDRTKHRLNKRRKKLLHFRKSFFSDSGNSDNDMVRPVLTYLDKKGDIKYKTRISNKDADELMGKENLVSAKIKPFDTRRRGSEIPKHVIATLRPVLTYLDKKGDVKYKTRISNKDADKLMGKENLVSAKIKPPDTRRRGSEMSKHVKAMLSDGDERLKNQSKDLLMKALRDKKISNVSISFNMV